MKHKLHTTILYSKDLVEVLDNVSTTFNKVTNKALSDMITLTKGGDKIINTVALSNLQLENDAELFKRLLAVNEKYMKIIPELKDKILNDLPDTMTANTNDVNIRLALSLISEGVFLAIEIIPVLNNLISRHYLNEKTEDTNVDNTIGINPTDSLLSLGKVLPMMEQADFEKIVSIIGEVPRLKTLKQEDTSIIPVDVITDGISNTFSIKGDTLSFLTIMFSFGSNNEVDELTLMNSFVGNPIMHIRLFIVDMEALRLEKLKEDTKILELRLLELKNEQLGKNDPKLAKAVRVYEEKVNKLNLKIERIAKSE